MSTLSVRGGEREIETEIYSTSSATETKIQKQVIRHVSIQFPFVDLKWMYSA